MSAITNRYEFVLLFDVENGNPNGDPDAGNMPRFDPETGHGLVTDVCLKRKVRNYVELAYGGEAPYSIYVREKAVLSVSRAPAYAALDKNLKDEAEKVAAAQVWMCQNFYDVRAFGAVMSTTTNNCGQVRGPVQLAFARSVEPVVLQEFSITRMAVETEKEALSQKGGNRTMGRKFAIPYGLYRAEGFISAPFAQKTGFTEEDLALFWQALTNMFEHDHSAARGKMSARQLVVFKHADKLGNAPAHKLFETIRVARSTPDKAPARCFGDYVVTLPDNEQLPAGVEMQVIL